MKQFIRRVIDMLAVSAYAETEGAAAVEKTEKEEKDSWLYRFLITMCQARAEKRALYW